jgi:hypothetical protein
MSYTTYVVRVYGSGCKNWYLDGELRLVERGEGTKDWYLNDKRHREDGPAIEFFNGDKYWFLNGEYHREDGPAVERSNGTKKWFLNDIQYTEEEFNREMSPTVEMTIAEIEELVGKKVKII